MPGQPSPTSSTSSGLDEMRSNSSSGVDSLGGESCDDLDTMQIPDAVVAVSPSKQSQRSKVQESTDGPTEVENGEGSHIKYASGGWTIKADQLSTKEL